MKLKYYVGFDTGENNDRFCLSIALTTSVGVECFSIYDKQAEIVAEILYRLSEENQKLKEELMATRKVIKKLSIKRDKWKRKYYKERSKVKCTLSGMKTSH